MVFSQYTTKDIDEVFRMLGSKETGLSETEAENRRKISGLNDVKIKESGLSKILIRQFKSSFFYLLLIASLLSFLLGETVNGALIIFFVFINVGLGFFQEARAEKAAKILERYIPFKTRVLREGEERTIERRELVPGDVVLLEAGNIVPADLRIIKNQNLLVDEGVLSGESAPVGKICNPIVKEAKEVFEAKNIIFGETSVISGEAEGIAVGTGKDTVFGEIARLATRAVKESAYEKNILHFAQIILKIVVVTIFAVFFLDLLVKGKENLFDFVIFCIALVVSIIPEALPLVATFSLSKGALKMAQEKVVVKRLSAVEDLGNMEILCTDKTGTLTENKLSLRNVCSSDREKCLLYGLLSSPYIKEEIESTVNPFDSAVFEKTPQRVIKSLREFKGISEIPFNPFSLRTSVLIRDGNGKKILIVKGAPEIILKLSSKTEGGVDKSSIKEEIIREGKEGKRVLAVAFKKFGRLTYSKEDEKGLTFLGYFSFADPLKKTAKSAIELSAKLGVKIKILTGDSPEVAGSVAKDIGLIADSGNVILGEELESLSDREFIEACDNFSVFARISPKVKFKIIEALQKKFEVGFLGEGINDAPALKLANVAIAVREGADISREVSDIVLLEKDLRAIVGGINEGRNIFSNINKYIKCTLSSNFGNFYSIAAISLAIPFLPMLPAQILLVNLLSDFPLIAIATDKVDVEELKKPKLYQLEAVIPLVISLALVSTVFDFIFFGIFRKAEPSTLQTLWFIESILTEIFLIFSVRTRNFFLKTKSPSLPLIFFSVLAIIITVLLPFTVFGREFFGFALPSVKSLFIVAFLIVSYLILSEMVKLTYFRRFEKNRMR